MGARGARLIRKLKDGYATHSIHQYLFVKKRLLEGATIGRTRKTVESKEVGKI